MEEPIAPLSVEKGAGGTATRPRRSQLRHQPRALPPGPLGKPYIQRQIPTYDVLGEENLLRIERATEQLLATKGIQFRDDPRALDRWRAAGARVEGVTVFFEPGMVADLLATAPRQFVQQARNRANSVVIGGDNLVFAPGYGAPFVMDLEGGRRYGTLADFQNFVKLAQSAPGLHHSGGTICEPCDLPVNKRHLDMLYSHIRYSDRPFMGSITAPERARDSVALARLLFGAERMEQDCCILGNVNANSPLMWDGVATGAIEAYAEANQGIICVPFILGGAMGPVTTAGMIVGAHAEALVGCAYAQLVRPGSPTVYGNFLSSMSMQTGSPTFGTPEPAIGSLVVGQLARRAGLPLRCSGSFSTSKQADAQAMLEATQSMLAAVHCGSNFTLHAAGLLDGLLSMSYEKFIMDCDLLASLHIYLAGVVVDDNALALDAFAEVPHAGHFFGCRHTLANYETAFWRSGFADNSAFESWQQRGSESAEVRANRLWKQQLADFQPPPLDSAIDAALCDFIDRKKRSLPDAWH